MLMHDFIYTIISVFRQAVPFALLGLAAGAVLLVLLGRRKEKRPSKGQVVAVLLLMCYLGGLVAVTLMSRTEDGFRMGVQLHPFLAFFEAWNAFTLRVWLNPLLNIAMFIPLGVLLPLAAKRFRQWYRSLAAGAGTSLVIEMFQYILGRGQADIDDLICNILGAMLGYCLCMSFVSLAGKRRRTAAAYAALPVLSLMTLAGVFLTYYLQPYGNLEDAPIYAANTKGVEWVQECELSDEPGPSGVYRAEPFTRDSCDAFAAEFLGRQGAELNSDSDVIYYDNSTFYSDHRTYSLMVYYSDRSYEYMDFRVDSELRYSDKGGTITEDELRAALDARGIDIPDAATFVVVDKERGRYAFRAECVVEDGVLTNGEIVCRVAEGGILCDVDNALSVSTLYDDAAVISPREAYERLCAGHFSYQDVPMFDYLALKQVRVTACTLEYMTDSKGFRQPVYSFTLSDDRDTELQSGNVWDTFVPALA